MDSLQFSILTGVVSGVLTSALIWTFIKFIYNIFIPWYQNSIYRGTDVSGQWTAKLEFNGAVTADQTINLKQRGHKLSGILTSRNFFSKPRKRNNNIYVIWRNIRQLS